MEWLPGVQKHERMKVFVLKNEGSVLMHACIEHSMSRLDDGEPPLQMETDLVDFFGENRSGLVTASSHQLRALAESLFEYAQATRETAKTEDRAHNPYGCPDLARDRCDMGKIALEMTLSIADQVTKLDGESSEPVNFPGFFYS